MAQVTRQALARRVEVALGRQPADLVVRNARLLDTATGSVRPAAVTIAGDTVVAVGEPREARQVIDAESRFVAPGLIDTHVHVESSMVTPLEFERLVLPRGTTTAICDPHEIANVLGVEGIAWFLAWAEVLGMTLRVNLSSCVPATGLETAGARLEVEDLLPLAAHPAVIGLAELMNFPGVLAGDEGLLRKLEAFAGRHVDGHAPLLGGAALDAYLAVGVRTDHECSHLEEAREKLAKGMIVLLREGSVAKNVAALAPLISGETWMRLGFCTDDRNPLEVLEEGHIDHALRRAIATGAPVIPAYRAATLGAATVFGLRDRGLVAPGYRADLILLDDLEEVRVSGVICGGRPVDEAFFANRARVPPVGFGSVRRAPVTAQDLVVPAPAGPTMPVIGVVPGSLVTEHLQRTVPVRDGACHADPEVGIHKLAVLERHGRNGNIGLGFVEGFGRMRGAIATSVGHDSHNLIVVGDEDQDMAGAIGRLVAMQGGCVVVRRGTCLADLPLPIAGLMSDRPHEAVAASLERLRQATRRIGCGLDEPLLQLAFLPLPVIPHLKLTDRGLVTANEDGLRLL